MRGRVGLAAIALLVGCGSLAEPDWVRDRAPLPSCGDVIVVGDDPTPDAAERCMLAALRDGTGAELIVRHRQPTDGLPVDGYSRLLPDGSAEFILHIDPERSGPEGWELHRCEDARVSDDGLGRLVMDGCEQVDAR